jgi:hypothetical protein
VDRAGGVARAPVRAVDRVEVEAVAIVVALDGLGGSFEPCGHGQRNRRVHQTGVGAVDAPSGMPASSS